MPIYEIHSYNEDGSTHLGYIFADDWGDAADSLGLVPEVGDRFDNPVGIYFVVPGHENLPYVFYLLESDGIGNKKELLNAADAHYRQKQVLKQFLAKEDGRRRLYPPPQSDN